MPPRLLDISIRNAPVARRHEWTLLFQCLSSFGTQTTPSLDLAGYVDDWSSFIAIAARQGLLPVAWDRLQGLQKEIPRDKLMRTSTLFGIMSRAAVQELFHLVADFRETGIDVITFKGPALASAAYGNLLLRQSGDLDLLVREKDFIPAFDTLVKRGYEPRIPRSEISAAVRRRKNGVTFGSSLVNIDLHWTLDDYPFEFKRDEEGIWDRARSVEVAGHEILGLSPQDQFLFVCFHGNKHNWVRLIWVCDVARSALLLDTTDWDHVVEHCARARASRMIAVAMLLAESYCGSELPAPIKTLIERDRKVRILARRVAAWLPNGPTPMDIRRYRMNVFEPLGEKSRVLAHTLRRRLFTGDL